MKNRILYLLPILGLALFPWTGFSTGIQTQEKVPVDLLPYVNARTILDFSETEIKQAYRELKDMEYGEDRKELPVWLQKVGKTVEALFSNLPKTSSLERISQERTEPGRTEQLYQSRDYYYLISPQTEPVDIGFEEFRTGIKDDGLTSKEPIGSFFLSTGHATHPVYFHPLRQTESRFRYLGRQKMEQKSGRFAHILAFAQMPTAAGMIRHLDTGDQSVLILLQGIAWIDPDSFQIYRMHTELLVPRLDAGLEYQTTHIRFTAVKFKDIPESLYLPDEVVVSMKYKGFLFRNRHRYSQYRLFSVESQDGPKVIAKP